MHGKLIGVNNVVENNFSSVEAVTSVDCGKIDTKIELVQKSVGFNETGFLSEVSNNNNFTIKSQNMDFNIDPADFQSNFSLSGLAVIDHEKTRKALKNIHIPIKFDKQEFFEKAKNKPSFSQEELAILIECKIIEKNNKEDESDSVYKVTGFFPDYGKFIMMTHHRLSRDSTAVYNFLLSKTHRNSRVSVDKDPLLTYVMNNNKIVVEEMTNKVAEDLTNYVGRRFFSFYDVHDIDYVKIVVPKKQYMIRDTLPNNGTNVISINVDGNTASISGARKEYEGKKSKIIEQLQSENIESDGLSERARKNIIAILYNQKESFIAVKDILSKYKNCLFKKASPWVKWSAPVKSKIKITNNEDLYFELVKHFPEDMMNDGEKVQRFTEYYDTQIAMLENLSEAYSKILSEIYEYNLPDGDGQDNQMLLIYDYDSKIHNNFSLTKQITALVIAIYIDDYQMVQGLYKGLSVFFRLDLDKISVQDVFSIDNNKKSEKNKMADILKLIALFQKMILTPKLLDQVQRGALKKVVLKLIELLPTNEEQKKGKEPDSVLDLNDFPLPYIWTLIKMLRSRTEEDYLNDKSLDLLNRLQAIYDQGLDNYVFAVNEHHKYLRIMEKENHIYHSPSNMFAQMKTTRDYFFKPSYAFILDENKYDEFQVASMHSKYHNQILKGIYLDLIKNNIFYEKFTEDIIKIGSNKNRIKTEYLEAFLNNKVLVNQDVLFHMLEEKFKDYNKKADAGQLNLIEDKVEQLRMERINLLTGRYNRLSQEARYLTRKLNWDILVFLFQKDFGKDIEIYEYLREKQISEDDIPFLLPLDMEKDALGNRVLRLQGFVSNMANLGFLTKQSEKNIYDYLKRNKRNVELDESLQKMEGLMELVEFPEKVIDQNKMRKMIKETYVSLFKTQGFANYDIILAQYYLAIDFIWRKVKLQIVLGQTNPASLQNCIEREYIKLNQKQEYVLMPVAFDYTDGSRPFSGNYYNFPKIKKDEEEMEQIDVKKIKEQLDFVCGKYPDCNYFFELREEFVRGLNSSLSIPEIIEECTKINSLAGIVFLDEKGSPDHLWGSDQVTKYVDFMQYNLVSRDIYYKFYEFERKIFDANKNNLSIEEYEKNLIGLKRKFNRLVILSIFSSQNIITPQEELINLLEENDGKLSEDQKRFLIAYIRAGRLLYRTLNIYELYRKDRGAQADHLRNVFLQKVGNYGYDFPFTMINIIATEQRDEMVMADVFYKYISILKENDYNPTRYLPGFIASNIEIPEMDNVFDLKAYELMAMLLYYNVMKEKFDFNGKKTDA